MSFLARKLSIQLDAEPSKNSKDRRTCKNETVELQRMAALARVQRSQSLFPSGTAKSDESKDNKPVVDPVCFYFKESLSRKNSLVDGQQQSTESGAGTYDNSGRRRSSFGFMSFAK